MTFGGKLQLLRKQKGMSQEQLASQLSVSRQAISKWELDSSLPDTDNVIQLSKLFGVSTDYLLKDEIENDADIPAVILNENDSKAEMNLKNSSIIGIGIMVIGFLISLVAWRTYQTEIAVSIGIVVQICGIIIFELMLSKCSISKKLTVKRRFYAISSWIICPFIALFLSRIALGIYPKPYSHWTALIAPTIIYFAICVTTTFIMIMIKTNAKEQNQHIS